VKILDWQAFVGGAFSGEPIAATIGVFDGLHIGHRALIAKILEKKGLQSAVFTFRENPKRSFTRGSFPGELSTLDQKLELLESIGADQCVLIDFSGDFSKLPGRQFLSLLSEKAALRYLALGEGFRCGYRLDTDGQAIRSFCEERSVALDLLPAVGWAGKMVSSSRIREAVGESRLDEAAIMLGRPYELDLRGFVPDRQARLPAGRYEAELVAQRPGALESLAVEVSFSDDGNWKLALGPEGLRLEGLSLKGLRLLRKVSRE
jgi:riboflavin kinase / FMN adenylyltransferase